MDLVACVPRDLADLVPAFLENRRADLGRLREAAARRDFAELEFLAQRMYAAGNPYGFRQITSFGRLLREASGKGGLATIVKLLEHYEDYLARVVVVQVDEPVVRQRRIRDRIAEGASAPHNAPRDRLPG